MPRISLIEEDKHPELAEIIDQLRRGRRGRLLDLYRLLLHSPAIAQAWFEGSNAVRWKTDIDGRLRELVIVRIGLIESVDYILKQHIPDLTTLEGISTEECAALTNWHSAKLFSERERAALAYTDAVTRNLAVPDEVFAEIARHFSERQIVELTVLVGFFNMAARVMRALRIDPKPQPDAGTIEPGVSVPISRRVIGIPVVVVEDDPFLRLIGILLDPTTSPERRDAFAEFFAHDEPDFKGYCERLRTKIPGLFPARIKMVSSTAELRAQLPGAHVLLVESLPVGKEELQAGSNLALVQQFGSIVRHIDMKACAQHHVRVLTLHRRSSMACAEMAISLMLTLAKKLHRVAGRISTDQLVSEGGPYRPFDRRHTPNSNWARIPGIRTLNETTLGIIGVGEIGREIVVRATAFGMRILYHQRTRLAEADEQALHLTYVSLDRLFAESDWIVPQLPSTPATRNFIDHARFAQMKPGAFLVNISRADLVDRVALLDALKSGRLGGFALDPLYESPGRSDDELLGFANVVMSPHIAAQPRFNVLKDLDDMLTRMAKELASQS